MTLPNPTMFEKVIAILKKKPVYIGLSCLVGLVLLWYLLTQIQSCRVQKATDKQLANINAHLGNIANRADTIANLNTEQAVEKEQVKEETNQHLNDINATEETKKQTNAMLANLANAKVVNTTNSSVVDLQKALDALNQ